MPIGGQGHGRLESTCSGVSSAIFRYERDVNSHCCALAQSCARCADGSAVGLDDELRNRQAYSGAIGEVTVDAIEPLEHVCLIVGCQASPSVDDFDADRRANLGQGDSNAAGLGVLNCISDQRSGQGSGGAMNRWHAVDAIQITKGEAQIAGNIKLV